MAWLTGLGTVGGGLWNFLECRKEWYKKYHVVNLAILTFSLTLLLFREMNSVLAFVSDAYCVYGSEASASEGEHPFVCRSVRLSVSAPFSSGSWGWPVPPLFSCLWDKLLAASLSPCLSRRLSQVAPKPQQPPSPLPPHVLPGLPALTTEAGVCLVLHRDWCVQPLLT